jgi:hypothetical protein
VRSTPALDWGRGLTLRDRHISGAGTEQSAENAGELHDTACQKMGRKACRRMPGMPS